MLSKFRTFLPFIWRLSKGTNQAFQTHNTINASGWQPHRVCKGIHSVPCPLDRPSAPTGWCLMELYAVPICLKQPRTFLEDQLTSQWASYRPLSPTLPSFNLTRHIPVVGGRLLFTHGQNVGIPWHTGWKLLSHWFTSHCINACAERLGVACLGVPALDGTT